MYNVWMTGMDIGMMPMGRMGVVDIEMVDITNCRVPKSP